MKPCITYQWKSIDFISFDEKEDEEIPTLSFQESRMIPFVEGTSFISSKQDLFILPEENIEKITRNHNITVVNVERQHLFGNFIEKGNSHE
jgi:hypothetical protein